METIKQTLKDILAALQNLSVSVDASDIQIGSVEIKDGASDARAAVSDERLHVNTEHPDYWSYHADGSSALTDAAVKADPGDGFQIVITDIIISNGSASELNFFLEEGSTKIFGPHYIEGAVGRGIVWKGKKHVTASTALTITTSAAVLHSVDILGYVQAV